MRKIVSKKRGENKKGLSPIITTVLLIALVIVIISIIFLWFRGMVQEGVTKFGKNIQLVCDEVQFEATYSSGILDLVNTGNIPLFRVNIRLSEGGNYQTKDITEISGGEDWPDGGLTQGGTFSGEIDVGDSEEITILPVLIGTSTKGKKTFVCGGQYGQKLAVSG